MKRRTAKVWRTTIATAGILLVSISTVQPVFAATDPATPSPKDSSPAAKVSNLVGHKTKNLCTAPTHPGEMACHSVVDLEVMTPMATTGIPNGYGATDLKSAYSIPTDTSGAKKTVAVVSAFDAVNAEADLAVYRAKFGLPECTTANGCFKKVDQNGGTSYPTPDASWAQETALDLDMVSAACPTCNVLLVEANSAYISDLGPSVNTAVQMGAIAVSNSYGGGENFNPSQFEAYYNHPGVAITASAGDAGYGINYPAASQYVTAVGGTSLRADSSVTRGWTEQAWGSASSGAGGTGSGCSSYNAKPSWQTDNGCTKRTVADISAVADVSTGVAVYDSASGGWMVFGGTSVSSPLVAGMFATAGKPSTNTYPSSYAYAVPSAANDVSSGSNGTCSPSYLCTSGAGYDGPTGLGTPNGAAALTDLASKFATAEASANFGPATSGITCVADGSCTKTYNGGKIKWTYAAGTVATPNAATPPPPPPITAPAANPLDAIDTSGNLWSYSTSGNTSLGARTALGAGWSGTKQLLSVDWNNDGKLDLVARGGDGYLRLYKGFGNGTFQSPITIGFGGWQNYDITATKLRASDTYPGLVARDTVGGNLYYYPNANGDALITARTMIGNGGWSPMSEINALDWDKDGKMDLIVRNPNGELLLYRTDGAGTILNEARKSVDFGWNVMDSISAEPNFAGPGTVGFIARTTSGNLYYYPIVNGRVGASTLIGNGGWSGYVIAAGTPTL